MKALIVFAPLAVFALSACGYTEQEMAAKRKQIDVLTAQVRELRQAQTARPTPAPCNARDKGIAAR